MRVLIAEDDLTSRDILASLLEKNGYNAITSENGAEAMRLMEQPDPPHIVILDWMMPEIDGLEVCRRIRTIKTDLPPYIIMLTIKGNKDDIVTGLDNGADDYLSKPYDPDELRARVDVGRRIVELKENLADRMKELSANHKLFRSFVENANDIIYTLNMDGVFTYVSPNWSVLLGHDVSEVSGQSFKNFVHSDDISACSEFMEQVILSGIKRGGIEYRVRHKDGTWHWHSSNASMIYDDTGGFSSFLGVARDITDRKLSEGKIRSLLAEKEIILQEVHHRIKNNMNTIKGLLYLHAEALTDSSAVAALHDAENRVGSMMVLYDELYRSEGFTELSINKYIPKLVSQIVDNFPGKKRVVVENHIDDFILKAGTLVTLGIIINELLTNIMKYAFTGKDSGIITISALMKDNRVNIAVADNGIGIPESVTFKNSTGFGMQLVGMLTEQIGGKIRIERGNGTRFVLEFDV